MSTENTTPETPVVGLAPSAEATTDTVPATPTPVQRIRRFKRGRHPDVTAGAFGNGRKHNGIKFRTSSLINRFA